MKDGRENECHKHCLEDRYFVPLQILKIKVSVEELMNYFIPLPCILIIIGGIPEILVKLPVSKPTYLSIEVSYEFKNHYEVANIQNH